MSLKYIRFSELRTHHRLAHFLYRELHSFFNQPRNMAPSSISCPPELGDPSTRIDWSDRTPPNPGLEGAEFGASNRMDPPPPLSAVTASPSPPPSPVTVMRTGFLSDPLGVGDSVWRRLPPNCGSEVDRVWPVGLRCASESALARSAMISSRSAL